MGARQWLQPDPVSNASGTCITTGGAYTYMITLPKEWVKKLKWRAKQMLELELKADKIEITDYPNK